MILFQYILLCTSFVVTDPVGIESLKGKNLKKINQYLQVTRAGSLEAALAPFPEQVWDEIPVFHFWSCHACKDPKEGIFYFFSEGIPLLLVGRQTASGSVEILNKAQLNNLEYLRGLTQPKLDHSSKYSRLFYEYGSSGSTGLSGTMIHHYIFHQNKLVKKWALPKHISVSDPFLYPIYVDPQPKYYPIFSAEFKQVPIQAKMSKDPDWQATYHFQFELVDATNETSVCQATWEITLPVESFDGMSFQLSPKQFLKHFPSSWRFIEEHCAESLLKKSPLK